MKKVLLSLLALSSVVLVACGPSKTYTSLEGKTKDAMVKLESAVDPMGVATIVTEWSVACDSISKGGELSGEEATTFGELTKSLQTKATQKADSLSKVAAEAAALAAAEAAAAAEAEAAANTKGGKK